MARVADMATIIRDGKIVEKRETEGDFIKRIAGEIK